ncbi:CAZyme family GH81 [Penicillium roqueforti]|uniref:CAZyme family GH81 n=1 Tax=Penicillium roqueforti TaxID=5082 RepID=UPI00190921F9|nr:CAZyme family GH81 [Penicillium roqueforti]KAF9247484.1 CAZyme family GH81 [Penicillium roqueforti]KAI1834824.1 CAZyme family GH81 [Penicillium roqueforti]KAI2676667.1 CAZyme family GH81 [Penicillium roqueforti]KAI2683542.1 CAZyme family GH81 [Penicillium roqueforti]KAI2702982.1 CAZyme family GH81 [Penicillium roqueforti]
MDSRLKWKATAVLTWLLATEKAYCLPHVGNEVEATLQNTATEPARAFETQYPPSNSEDRLLIPESHPVYRVALEQDGHSSQQPFPQFDIIRFVDGLEDLLGSGGNTPAPTLTATGQSTGTGKSHPIQATTSAKQPENPAPIHTAGSVTYSPQAGPSTTVAHEPVHILSSSSVTSKTMPSQDIFQPVATGPVPANIKSRDDHPVQNQHANTTNPIATNKFYAGLFLGSQTNATFTQPYSLAWSKGGGSLKSWGMAVSHVQPHMLAYGPPNSKIPGNPVQYYINPIGLQSLIFSATELNQSSIMNVNQPKAFSAHAVIKPSEGSAKQIVFPVVQGMGYATAVYSDLQPVIESGVFFRKVVSAGSPRSGIFKYQVYLEDDMTWLLYATPADGKDPEFKLVSNSRLRGPQGFSGTIQVAKNPAGKSGEKFYDNSSGVYPVAGKISGSVTDDVGTYTLSWKKAGKDVTGTPLIMFALPHHVQSFDGATKSRITDINLRTTTKGNSTAVIGESWTMVEQSLPIDIGFAPWSTTQGSSNELSASAQHAILQAAPQELKQNISGQTDLNSMYYSGKALSKFATLVYTVNQLGNSSDLATDAFQKLKKSFDLFVQNKQQYPLAYDSVWKGVVSTAGYNGDLNQDFGNTAYNDHHFHYGYFIQAAAIIGSLDPSWLAANKEWVNMLVRDAGNSVPNDPYFPFSRSFDWYNGHSWAKGLFESFDGKDQESTSEDTMFAYAIKMWGQTTGDASMEARGNIMLSILGRSLNNYFLMEDDNVNQPANFTANRVTGILFENKVDHTTYFGANLEYVQGIHMLPLMPHSPFTRRKEFVRQEWQAMFAENASTPASKVEGGWKGVLYANLALIDPKSSWDFFAQSNFDYSWIDGGATRTWYLAFIAGLGGAP